MIGNSGPPLIKTGVKLPETNQDWSTANTFFQVHLDRRKINDEDIDECVKNMNDLAYDYFKDNYGLVNDISAEVKRFEEKYKNYNRNKLKRVMKYLKSQNENSLAAEIKFVAKLLRSMVTRGGRKYDSRSIDHDTEIRYSFWKYVKRVLVEPTSIFPNFDLATCTSYFKNVFHCPQKANFSLPAWIPILPEAKTEFDLEPPTYQEVSRTIFRMKSSKSPCPTDQISVIMLKRCPFLRTYLPDIINHVWSSKKIPAAWRLATTILIHKKGSPDDPGNFRLIILQPICLKFSHLFFEIVCSNS